MIFIIAFAIARKGCNTAIRFLQLHFITITIALVIAVSRLPNPVHYRERLVKNGNIYHVFYFLLLRYIVLKLFDYYHANKR